MKYKVTMVVDIDNRENEDVVEIVQNYINTADFLYRNETLTPNTRDMNPCVVDAEPITEGEEE